MLDLDRYYTPDDVADRLLEHVDASELNRCVDSTCGDGSLLLAARRAFKDVECAGVDKDRAAIQRLRRRYPDWDLSVADVLSPRFHPRSIVLTPAASCDLLTLNPPFSVGRTKSVLVPFGGETLRSSVAMAHILRSTDLFAPKHGAIAIVPESLLYSDVDHAARLRLRQTYRINVVAKLRNTTFLGARANAIVVRLTPAQRRAPHRKNVEHPLRGIDLVRGGLPVFESTTSRRGLPYVHSTDILEIVRTRSTSTCRHVAPIERGRVAGTVILLPRVGVPSKEAVVPVFLRATVQLSDCVFALRFGTHLEAATFAARLLSKWRALTALYRGTGARYITKQRLEAWLASV